MGASAKPGAATRAPCLWKLAWAAARAPGPLRGFFIRVRAKRGHQIAAVAVARKLAVLCWHMLTKNEDYRWARPSLVAHKRRAMELAAGKPQKKGSARGAAYAYNVKALRNQEMQIAERAQESYEHFVAAWQPRPKRRPVKAESLPEARAGCAAASPRQGFDGPPGDACSRRAALRNEVDRTIG